MRSPFPLARRAFLTSLLCMAAAFAGGCATYQVRIPDSDPLFANYESRTVHALAWGSWYSPQVVAAECEGEGLNDVRINRTLLHDLASVLTLGFWMPIEVEFRCKAPLGDVNGCPEFPLDPSADP